MLAPKYWPRTWSFVDGARVHPSQHCDFLRLVRFSKMNGNQWTLTPAPSLYLSVQIEASWYSVNSANWIKRAIHPLLWWQMVIALPTKRGRRSFSLFLLLQSFVSHPFKCFRHELSPRELRARLCIQAALQTRGNRTSRIVLRSLPAR